MLHDLLLGAVYQLIFIGSTKAGLDPGVLPQGLRMFKELLQNNHKANNLKKIVDHQTLNSKHLR